jgi:hypothetical protein
MGMTMTGGEGRDVDQDVLDDGDGGRRAQTARVGERRENHEGDQQRQIRGESRAGDAQRSRSPPAMPTNCRAM